MDPFYIYPRTLSLPCARKKKEEKNQRSDDFLISKIMYQPLLLLPRLEEQAGI